MCLELFLSSNFIVFVSKVDWWTSEDVLFFMKFQQATVYLGGLLFYFLFQTVKKTILPDVSSVIHTLVY